MLRGNLGENVANKLLQFCKSPVNIEQTLHCKLHPPDNLARHFTVGAALVLSPNLEFRVGYNHLQRRELRLDNTSGSAGLSFGAKIAISGFQLDYTYATLQAAAASNYFTLSKKLTKK